MSGTIHSITIHASFPGKVNFAAHQNAVPIVRDLGIENSSEDQYQNLRLTISAHPAFLRERVWILDRFESKTSLHIKDSFIDYDANMLFGLNEAINADIRLTLTTEHGGILASHQEQVRVLSRNEWGGSHFLPELLAAFVQPNDPTVEAIQKQAAELLRRKDLTLDGWLRQK